MDLDRIIQSHIDNFETQLCTHIPAKVISFDSQEQTMTVEPFVYEAYSDGVSSKPAQITDVPVIFYGAGGGVLTFPVRAGDEVLLAFSQRDIDLWWDTGQEGVPLTQHYHDYNDGIALLGLTSKANSVNASTTDVQLRFEDSTGELNSITLAADKSITLSSASGSQVKQLSDGNIEITSAATVKIQNNGEELISLVSDLMELLATTTTNTMIGPQPLNFASQIASLKSRLDTLKG
tara:strand:+ start:23823 stop:24527 length:705 start_codon:yes stop_codon:yes gene_type:complete